MYHLGVANALPPLPQNADDCLKNFLSCCFRQDPAQRPTAKQLLAHPWLA